MDAQSGVLSRGDAGRCGGETVNLTLTHILSGEYLRIEAERKQREFEALEIAAAEWWLTGPIDEDES